MLEETFVRHFVLAVSYITAIGCSVKSPGSPGLSPTAPSKTPAATATAGSLRTAPVLSASATALSAPNGGGGAAVTAEPQAQSPQSEYSILLATPNDLSVTQSGEYLLVFTQEVSTGFTVAPGYILDKDGLREQASLLSGFPDAPGNRDTHAGVGRVIYGQISILGSWPSRAKAVRQEFPFGGCVGCYEEYEWRRDHWVPVKPTPIQPAWFKISDLGPSPSRVDWKNGTTYWERYNWNTNESVLFLDPMGQRRAQRQRARCPSKGSSAVRLTGPLSATPLSDGGLLSVGVDCTTHRPLVEFWRKGALESKIELLPGAPESLESTSAFVDPVKYFVRSPSDIVVAFASRRGGELWPYLAAFDGNRWKPLWPPIGGEALQVERDGSGAIWVRGYAKRAMIRRHPGPPKGDEDWGDATAEGMDDRSLLVQSPNGISWLTGSSQILEWQNGSWRSHRLPDLSASGRNLRCVANQIMFVDDNNPAIVARCGEQTALIGRQRPAVVIAR